MFPQVRWVQTYVLHKSTSLLPDSSDRLRQVMFLRWVRMSMLNLLIIVPTHTWYMIQVQLVMTVSPRQMLPDPLRNDSAGVQN